MTLIGGFIGLYKVGFVVPWGVIAAIALISTAVNYGVALLVSLGTRFITPRSLVSN